MNNKQDFLTYVTKAEQNTIAIDFDGVIHNHNLGFHDGTIYGDPILGSLEAIKSLSTQYQIIIYTCKANPNRPLINNKTGIELIWEWLDKYGFTPYIKDITFTKPNAKFYIDDKAIYFDNWKNVLETLNDV